jgi:hypothetical protein
MKRKIQSSIEEIAVNGNYNDSAKKTDLKFDPLRSELK